MSGNRLMALRKANSTSTFDQLKKKAGMEAAEAFIISIS